MIDALAKGDEVVTSGGVLGKISKIGDTFLGVEIANGVEIQVQRSRRRPGAAQGHGQVSTRSRERCALVPPEVEPMNRYPVWKYAIMVIALLVGLIYTLPNFFGEAPAVQVSSGKATVKVDAVAGAAGRADPRQGRPQARLRPVRRQLGQGALRRPRRAAQGQGRDQRRAEPRPERPDLHRRAEPAVALAALADRAARAADVPGPRPARRRPLPDAGRHEGGADQEGRVARRRHAHAAARQERPPRRHRARRQRRRRALPRRRRRCTRRATLLHRPVARPRSGSRAPDGTDFKLTGTLKPDAAKRVQDAAIKQNITTLHNRVNELGVAEPVIQQQGADRIVVQLPGVQDTAKAKDIIGRTATLEMRMVDDSAEAPRGRDRRRPGAVRRRALRRPRRRAGDRQAAGACSPART